MEITVDEVKMPAYKPRDETAIPFIIAGETCILLLFDGLSILLFISLMPW